MYADKYASSISDIPADTKYLVLTTGSYLEEGYGPSDKGTPRNKIEVACFFTKEKMQEYVSEYYGSKPMQVVPYSPLVITKRIEFSFE